MIKLNFYGNSYIGIYSKANDEFTLIPEDSLEKYEKRAEERLKTKMVRWSFAGSALLGIYCAMNSNGIILPDIGYKDEIDKLKHETGINIGIIKTKRTAVGNMISCNDNGAIVSPLLEKSSIKKIEDCLGVEAIGMKIAGYSTVGSCCLATNNGFVVHNDASDDEISEIEDVLKVEGINSTVNFGFPFPSYGIVANSNGYVVGDLTTGIEIMRVDNGLGFSNR